MFDRLKRLVTGTTPPPKPADSRREADPVTPVPPETTPRRPRVVGSTVRLFDERPGGIDAEQISRARQLVERLPTNRRLHHEERVLINDAVHRAAGTRGLDATLDDVVVELRGFARREHLEDDQRLRALDLADSLATPTPRNIGRLGD